MNSYDDKNQDSVDLKIADSDDSASTGFLKKHLYSDMKKKHVEEDDMELDLVEIDPEPNYLIHWQRSYQEYFG